LASRFCSFQSSFSIIVAAKEVKLFQKMKILPFFGQFYREKSNSTQSRISFFVKNSTALADIPQGLLRLIF